MTSNQYRAALKTLDLSQHRAAALLGLAPRTSAGYALGEYPVPPTVATLLRLLVKGKITPQDIKDAK